MKNLIEYINEEKLVESAGFGLGDLQNWDIVYIKGSGLLWFYLGPEKGDIIEDIAEYKFYSKCNYQKRGILLTIAREQFLPFYAGTYLKGMKKDLTHRDPKYNVTWVRRPNFDEAGFMNALYPKKNGKNAIDVDAAADFVEQYICYPMKKAKFKSEVVFSRE